MSLSTGRKGLLFFALFSLGLATCKAFARSALDNSPTSGRKDPARPFPKQSSIEIQEKASNKLERMALDGYTIDEIREFRDSENLETPEEGYLDRYNSEDTLD